MDQMPIGMVKIQDGGKKSGKAGLSIKRMHTAEHMIPA